MTASFTIKSLATAIFCLSAAFCGAQSKEYTHQLFSFKIHDDFVYQEVEGSNGLMAYVSSTIIMDIGEEKGQPNAAKYTDQYEGRVMDSFETQVSVDTLDGWPVILLTASRKSDAGTYLRRSLLFDNGESTFMLSISGWTMDQRIVDEMFQVTQSSFRFAKGRRQLPVYSFDVPRHMSVDHSAKMIWSRCYNIGNRTFDNQIRFNEFPEDSFESAIKDQRKALSKDKAVNIVDEVIQANGITIAKIGGTRTIKLEKGNTKVERKVVYIISNPKGGVSKIWFTGDDKVGPMMESGMDNIMRTCSPS
jgi:hypothetical protein